MSKIGPPTMFDWDSGNSGKNYRKHKVLDREAEQVFQNVPAVQLSDPKHSSIEERRGIIGKTDSGRMLFVTYTMRLGRIRVISARPMSKKERNLYEEETEKTSEI